MYFSEIQGVPLWHGVARLHPDRSIIAGEVGTWQLVYQVGRYGIDDGGRIKVAMRLASDWATPQVEDPSREDYLSVQTTGDAKVSAAYEWKGYIRPWFRVVSINVSGEALKEGDQIIITYGDTSAGGGGTRAQTFSEKGFELLVLVESFESGVFVRVPYSTKIDILGGPAARLVVIAPSRALIEEPVSFLIKAEDKWGNPSNSYSQTVSIEQLEGVEMLPESYTFKSSENGKHRFTGVKFNHEGVYRIKVFDSVNGLSAVSNPIRCLASKTIYHMYWGDLHGQTRSTVGTGTVAEYFQFARDVAALDVCCHQGNDFQITKQAWKEIKTNTKDFCEPGRFVTFLGYEWSGNTPAGGDHNVIWLDGDQPLYRSSHWQVNDNSDAEDDRYPISELIKTIKDKNVFLIPHIGGRRANLDYFAPALMPVIEICSVHGRFEYFLREALEKGCKVGVVANGDDHTGRPGASYATNEFNRVRSGLTCILADTLDREAIWKAIKARHTYATSGERIYLSIICDNYIMGDEFLINEQPTFNIEIVGTNPLSSVEILRGNTLIYSDTFFNYSEVDLNRISIAWQGARAKGRDRVTIWDGEIQIERGSIKCVSEFAFDDPRDGIITYSDSSVTWKSTTSGDIDGIIIEYDGSDKTRFVFHSEPITFPFNIQELQKGPAIYDAGGIDQKVRVSLCPNRETPNNIIFTFRDEGISKGLNPYYVRVTQVDGEMAWSSPMYIKYNG